MDDNRKYVVTDVLGVPALNEVDAKFKAKEALKYLKKKCIRIYDAKKPEGRSTYDVNVEYVDEDDYEKIEGKVKDVIYVPSSTENNAIRTAIEALKFQKKQYINIVGATKCGDKEKYAVEVEYVDEKPNTLK